MTATPDAPLLDGAEPSDAELLAAVRGGDDDAFGLLWSRHEAAARRLARQITRPSEADDLVSESFVRVLRAIKGGGGPDAAFRPYLLSTMRRFNIDTGRAYHQRVLLTEDESDLDVDHSASVADIVAETGESRAAWNAWQSLPESSRTLLWHLIIEEETPAQIAPLLGTTANGVASRAVRAKERLRQAFLSQHLAAADEQDCRDARAKFGGYVRNALSGRDRKAVDEHVAGCARCRAALAEIADTNSTLRGVIAPIVLASGVVAGRYLAATHTAAAAKGGAVGLLAARRAARNGARHAATVPAAAVAAGAAAVVAIAVGAVILGGGHHHRTLELPAGASRAVVSSSASGAAQTRPTSPAPTTPPTRPSTRRTRRSSAPAPGPVPPQSGPGGGSSAPSGGGSGSSRPGGLPTKLPPLPPIQTVSVGFTLLTGVLGTQITLSASKGWQVVSVTSTLGPQPVQESDDTWDVGPGTVGVQVTVAGSRSGATLEVDTPTAVPYKLIPIPLN